MKKITTSLFLLLAAGIVQAQRYQAFYYDGKEGLTDSNGVEIVPPLYDRHDWLEIKQWDVMRPVMIMIH
ncbi:hypothetical protein ACTHGU_00585 [Chitinophagaceae bacterium MMS25-I14]